jgi:NADP-dependent 3-hydroxy acid dehydrogenase YdfG
MMRNVIVTGASKGVGYATCKILAALGYKVIAVSRNKEKMQGLMSDNIETYQLDLTDFDAIRKFFDKYKDIKLDAIINNAGGGSNPRLIYNEEPEDFNYAYSLNVSGPMLLSKLFTDNLKTSNNPTIIFVSSIGGKFPYRGGGNYTNAKRGVGGLVDTMRLEYPQYGIKITEIIPGTIDTVEPTTLTLKEQAQRIHAITAGDMALTIKWVLEQPSHVNINYIELNHIHSGRF